MVQISIGQGQGITQAIKAQIQANGGQITNNSLSVWQDVMNEVKTANNNRGEGKDPFYTGGDDTTKLSDRQNWKTDFQVKLNQVIDLAQDVWDRIVEKLTSKKPEQTQQAPQSQPAEQSQQPAAAEQPAQQPTSEPVSTEQPPSLSEEEVIKMIMVDDKDLEIPDLKPKDALRAAIPQVDEENAQKRADHMVKEFSIEAGKVMAIRAWQSAQELAEYLDNDTTYQSYLTNLDDIDYRMSEIEAKYEMPRIRDPFKDEFELGSPEFSAQFNILGKPEENEYTNLGLEYQSLKRDLEEYETVMQNWTDGKNLGTVKRFGNGYNYTYTNVQCITLQNGQHAYKCDQGTFYPDSNGNISNKPVPENLIN